MAVYGKRLLIVDDEDDICQIVKGKFEAVGYEVLTANNVPDGFKKAEQKKPDCIFLDNCISGGEGGYAFLKRLRNYQHSDPYEQQRMRNTPVIIVTGAGAELQPLYEMEKISAFVKKPFDLNELQEKVEQALRSR